MAVPHQPRVDFDAFVDRLYVLAEEPNHFTGDLSAFLDNRLTWFTLKLALQEWIADEWIAWMQRDAEARTHAS